MIVTGERFLLPAIKYVLRAHAHYNVVSVVHLTLDGVSGK